MPERPETQESTGSRPELTVWGAKGIRLSRGEKIAGAPMQGRWVMQESAGAKERWETIDSIPLKEESSEGKSPQVLGFERESPGWLKLTSSRG